MNPFGTSASKNLSFKTPDSRPKIQLKEAVQAKQDNQNKFKTELCRNLQSGFCEFGSKCFFAHSLEELRNKSLQPVIKSVKCTTYFASGYCISGSRCQFSHRDTSPETAANSPKHSKATSRKSSEDLHNKPVFFDLESRGFF